VVVYVAATAAGTRLLAGRLRAASAVSLALVLVVLAFSGPYLAAPLAIGLLAVLRTAVRVRREEPPGAHLSGACDVDRITRVHPDLRLAACAPVGPGGATLCESTHEPSTPRGLVARRLAHRAILTVARRPVREPRSL
jgi:hypothetical protein